MKTIDVAVVVLESTLLSTAFGVEDMLMICNQFCKRNDEASFKVNRISEGKFIIDDTHYDVIIIPPLLVPSGFTFELSALNAWLIHHYHTGTILTSACVGSFFLAKTGLLDGKKATTHWQYEENFRASFSSVTLESDKILIDEGKIITAGGVSAYMDLVLHIIEKFHSKESAQHCANILLVDRGRDSQKCYKELSQATFIEDDEIKELLLWIKENLRDEYSTAILSQRLKLHERTFMRRFKNSVHSTPNQYIQELRVDAAKSLLVTTYKSFDEITSEVGFENESSFRRLFKRETLLNPGEYRKKFQYHAGNLKI